MDPKYKKTDTRDFTIVKRAIRLWDRTMHKYRYRIELWKQYLAFCYVVKSRKTFYKALSNAVKFNPFSLELWLSGVYYEFEVNKNPWKARKVYHKALKVNRTNLEFWV
jgi:U3 small nucleolar RNA-associated protein 6